MTAEIVSVGTELLLGQIVDTHAATMGRILADCGIGCMRRSTVGDNRQRLNTVLKEALERADLVITIGGLGPTMDDLTRDAIADVFDDEMERVPEMEAELRTLFEKRKLRWTETILRQADKPRCASFIENPNGTAPGLICVKSGKTVIALPGPKNEFDPMANGPVRDYLSRLLEGRVIHSQILRVVGLGESHVEDLLRPLMEAQNPTVAPYAQPGEVHLRVTARASSREEGQQMVAPVVDQIVAILGDRVLPPDVTNLEEAIVRLLKDRRETLATAESMTGGDLAGRVTSVPGSSTVFSGGVVAYTAVAKQLSARVPIAVLAEHGPVSEEVAKAMAVGIREELQTNWSLSITGNAGPGSDTDGKSVGLVFIGLAGPAGVSVVRQGLGGHRADVRRRATQVALTMLRDALLQPSEACVSSFDRPARLQAATAPCLGA